MSQVQAILLPSLLSFYFCRELGTVKRKEPAQRILRRPWLILVDITDEETHFEDNLAWCCRQWGRRLSSCWAWHVLHVLLVVMILEDSNENIHGLNKTKFWHLLHMSKMIKTFSVIGMRLSTSLAWPEELPLLVAVVKNLLRVFFSITR